MINSVCKGSTFQLHAFIAQLNLHELRLYCSLQESAREVDLDFHKDNICNRIYMDGGYLIVRLAQPGDEGQYETSSAKWLTPCLSVDSVNDINLQVVE